MRPSPLQSSVQPKGRGAGINTPNRFQQQHLEPLALDEPIVDDEGRSLSTVFYKDTSKSILARNDSPDIPFTYSLNVYRGCEHGCIYCYARPSHEYLGFSAGLDFESKIMVKHDAPKLLVEAFRKKSWQPQMVCLSGNSDCYQPIERKLRLTRQCLEVFLKFRNPVGIITKNHLITRDIDILRELAALNLVTVSISLSSLNEELVRKVEPRTSTPARRLDAIEELSKNNIPVGVLLAPIIPGLTDDGIPAVLKEISIRGASYAHYIMLRLPGAVEPLFTEWVQREFPERAGKILHHVRDVRGGKMNDTVWSRRMKGTGEYAKTIGDLFKVHAKKYRLNERDFHFDLSQFKREQPAQLEMFG